MSFMINPFNYKKNSHEYKIYLGGNFTSYNGTTVNHIIKLNENGSIDTTFNTGTNFNDIINTITTNYE